MKDLGVIGLGPMGKSLVESLLVAGYPVACYDTDTKAVATTAMHGASPATSARQVAESSDIVFTVLPGPAEVRSAILDDDGVLAGARSGGIVIDLSTCDPATASALEGPFSASNATFIDAPVSGRYPRATLLVGGEDGVFDSIADVIDAISTTVVYCGKLGDGYATKLLNQHVKYSWYLAACEAFILADRLGLDAKSVARALEASSAGRSGLRDASEYFTGDTSAVRRHAPARTIAKDIRLALEMAADSDVSVPTLQVVADFTEKLVDTLLFSEAFPQSNELLQELRTRNSTHEN